MGLLENVTWDVQLALDGARGDCSLEAPRPTSLAHCSVPAPPSDPTLTGDVGKRIVDVL